MKSIPDPKILVLIAVLALTAPVFGQSEELSLVDIFTALRSKKANFPEKNRLLTEGVRQRGITFVMNKSLEDELRNAGASDELIDAIRKFDPAPQPAATPETKPEKAAPDHTFYQNRGNSGFVLGDYAAAAADYTKAIELKSDDPGLFLSRGIAYLNEQKLVPAIRDFDRVIELDPEESMAFYNRGTAYEKAGDLEKALADYRKAFEIDAGNEPALDALKKLEARLPKPAPADPPSNPAEEAARNTKESPNANNTDNSEKNPGDGAGSVNLGSLQERAVRLTTPVYPLYDRQRSIGGLVTVRVTVDEEGKVRSATATNGPKSLRRVSEAAAKRSKFKPFMVEGKPVTVTGYISYNFKPE